MTNLELLKLLLSNNANSSSVVIPEKEDILQMIDAIPTSKEVLSARYNFSARDVMLTSAVAVEDVILKFLLLDSCFCLPYADTLFCLF